MISLLIFQVTVLVFVAVFALNYVMSILNRIEKFNKSPFMGVINLFLPKELRFVIQYVSLGLAIVVLLFASIFPYIEQQKDLILVDEYNSNITLYTQYSDDFADAARKQIEEYQKAQSDMARTASVQQLQFWSQQRDVVGNQLTDNIKKFQDLIMQQKLAINSAQARIDRRPNNIWYFGVK